MNEPSITLAGTEVDGTPAIPPKVFHLKCSVCGAITGDITLPGTSPLDPDNFSPSDLGVGDTRCDAHPPTPPQEYPDPLPSPDPAPDPASP